MKILLLLIYSVATVTAQSFQHSYAIVVGIHVYEAMNGLPNARKDAESIAAVLKGQGYTVTELYDQRAQRAAIIDALDLLATQATDHDRIVFFFAGHGTTLPRGGKDWGYIVPYDGREQQISTLISMEELQAGSERMGNARHQLFLMDSCYGGSIGRDIPSGVSRNTPNYLAAITERIAREALTAGGKNQQVEDGANGHSIFTTALLEALRDGKADLDNDGIITFPELSAYVLGRATTRRQTPERSILPGNGMGEYWFVSPNGATTVIAPPPPGSGPIRTPGRGASTPEDPPNEPRTKQLVELPVAGLLSDGRTHAVPDDYKPDTSRGMFCYKYVSAYELEPGFIVGGRTCPNG